MSTSSVSSPISSPVSSLNLSSVLAADFGPSLFEACRNGDLETVRTLLSTPEEVNARDLLGRKSTPLHFAAGTYGRPVAELYYCTCIISESLFSITF